MPGEEHSVGQQRWCFSNVELKILERRTFILLDFRDPSFLTFWADSGEQLVSSKGDSEQGTKTRALHEDVASSGAGLCPLDL